MTTFGLTDDETKQPDPRLALDEQAETVIVDQPRPTAGVPAPAPRNTDQGNGSGALMAMIERAVLDPSYDVEKLKALLAIKKDWEADEARKAFVAAKAAFKADAPTVGKNKHVGFKGKDNTKPATDYWHATLDNIVQTIDPLLARHGLAYSWQTKQSEAGIEVTCILTHKMGHSEQVVLRANADNTGNKNSIQAVGSTITYLERYTLLAITGTATADQDDGGEGATMMIDEKQKAELIDLIKKSGADTKKYLAHMQIESLDQLPAARFPAARKALLEKIQVNAAKQTLKPDVGDDVGDDFPGDRKAKPEGDARSKLKKDVR